VTRLGPAAGDTFRSFRARNFRLFFVGQLVSQVGNWLTLVAQALLVLKLTDSGVALGVLAAAQFGPVLVVGPFAGVVADRSDKRRLLIAVQSLAMLQSWSLGALALLDRPPLGAIYAVALVGGFTVAFGNPARRSFVAEMVPEDDIGNAVSLNSALMTSSRVIGPALAGLLVSTVGFAWCFFLDGFSYLAVLAALWRMDPAALRPAPVTPRGRGQVREGLRYVRGVAELRVPLAMMAVVGTFAFNFQTVLPLFAIRAPAGHHRHLHPVDVGAQPRVGGRGPGHRPPAHDRRPHRGDQRGCSAGPWGCCRWRRTGPRPSSPAGWWAWPASRS